MLKFKGVRLLYQSLPFSSLSCSSSSVSIFLMTILAVRSKQTMLLANRVRILGRILYRILEKNDFEHTRVLAFVASERIGRYRGNSDDFWTGGARDRMAPRISVQLRVAEEIRAQRKTNSKEEKDFIVIERFVADCCLLTRGTRASDWWRLRSTRATRGRKWGEQNSPSSRLYLVFCSHRPLLRLWNAS